MEIRLHNPFSPIVYIHWSKEVCLYIGHSGRGLSRPFSTLHKMWKHRGEVTHTDIYYTESKRGAVILERELTHKLKPKYDESALAGYGKFGKANHTQRIATAPDWVFNDEKLKQLTERSFSGKPELAERLVRIIHLYYRDGYTSKAIAQKFQMSPKAVQNVIARARKTIDRPLVRRGRPRKILQEVLEGSDGD